MVRGVAQAEVELEVGVGSGIPLTRSLLMLVAMAMAVPPHPLLPLHQACEHPKPVRQARVCCCCCYDSVDAAQGLVQPRARADADLQPAVWLGQAAAEAGVVVIPPQLTMT